jgi:lipopolysaccharide transport system ATP-binding protein
MSTVIKVENLSKQYRLGNVGAVTFKEDSIRSWAKIRGKIDPFLEIGKENDRTIQDDTKFVWSLKDINFEVKQGDVLGVIGSNGAGKSTLLKILSKVTAPTTGSVKVKGRIASLLEVGTGFHPELTGRENIYLNGAILGMRKQEITRKLDEIIAFAGVEKYVDTPVKRYSSGMYVRLAFAVAAHLESEILIVDEVLAVGDGEFQKKCLGKMGDISKGEGRTVLFVSHNMVSIQNLCNKSIYLKNGMLINEGVTNDLITNYLMEGAPSAIKLSEYQNRTGNADLKVVDCHVFNSDGQSLSIIETFKDFRFKLFYDLKNDLRLKSFRIDIGINNILGERVAWFSTLLIKKTFDLKNNNQIEFLIRKFPLSPGDYNCNIYIEINNEISDYLINVVPFKIIELDYYGTGFKAVNHNQGKVLLDIDYVI